MSTESADFAEFYAQAKNDCLRAVLASVRDRLTAEELVEEAFARAWASWRKVSKHPMPRAWVVRTALNADARSWRHRRHEVLTPEITENTEPVFDADGDEVMAAVLQLPLRQRQVIGLRIFLDLDTAATARVLGIAPGTVTAHLSNAMATLRAIFVPTEGESR